MLSELVRVGGDRTSTRSSRSVCSSRLIGFPVTGCGAIAS